MDLQGIKKIEDLIIGSPILTPPERAEWMALLGLMDDAQLLELEGILISVQTPKVSAPKPTVQPTPSQTPNIPQTPKLAHIMNLPSNLGVAPLSSVQKPMPMPRPAAPAKALSGLSARLKQMLSEPELPPGHPDLDLPAGEEKPFLIKKEPQPKPPAQPQILAEPKAFPLSVPKPPRPQPIIARPASVLQQPKLHPMPEPAGIASLPQHASIKSAFKPPVSQAPPTIQEKPVLPAAAPPAAAPKKLLPEKLGDLPSLTPEIFQDAGIDNVVKVLKNLTKQFGYYQVVFNIEKSPLYQSYLITGAALLKTQGDFAQLAATGQQGDYLTRAQFELVADVLREIQGG